jgi:UDP-N-acetylmuramoylalanine--D-glutamate ligase
MSAPNGCSRSARCCITTESAAILDASGRTPVTAGNTRFGVPLSEAHLQPGDITVAELSSFQLEGCKALRPDAAVLTNVTLDHLYRHGSIEAYTSCKRRMFDGVPAAAVEAGFDIVVDYAHNPDGVA